MSKNFHDLKCVSSNREKNWCVKCKQLPYLDNVKEVKKQDQGSPRFYEILEELKQLHDKKNKNYATDQEPLSNFRECERLGIPAWKGCLIRMLDKMSRLVELSKGKEDLVNESFVDTLRDLAVYSILCEVLYEEKK